MISVDRKYLIENYKAKFFGWRMLIILFLCLLLTPLLIGIPLFIIVIIRSIWVMKMPEKEANRLFPRQICLHCDREFFVEKDDIEKALVFDCPFCKGRLFFKDKKLCKPD